MLTHQQHESELTHSSKSKVNLSPVNNRILPGSQDSLLPYEYLNINTG